MACSRMGATKREATVIPRFLCVKLTGFSWQR
jgi:hypothetical protein